MSDARSRIVIDIVGLEGIQAWVQEQEKAERQAVATQKAFLLQATASKELDAEQAKSLLMTARVATEQARALEVVNRMALAQARFDASLKSSNRSASEFLTTMVRYQVVGTVFREIAQVVRAATSAMEDYDRQTARTTRITGDQNRPVVSAALREGTALTGADIKDVGEVYYQLGTYIKGTTDQLTAYRNELKLIEGTEGDARTTARASLQTYEQFGDQLPKNISVSEKLRRVNELLAISFKDSSAELNEMSNALKYLGPMAETAGVKVEQLFAMMTALTAQGIRGRMEGTEAGSFISRIIKAYDDGQKGIQSGDKVYHFDFARNAQGGLDMLRTLEDIYRRHQELLQKDAKSAQEYYVAIGGSAQAIRFLGGMTDQTFARIREETDKNTQALKGQTHVVDQLASSMDKTFSATSARAWQGFLGVISASLDEVARSLAAVGALKYLADGALQINKNATNDALGAQRLLTQSPLEHAIEMRGILRRASSRMDDRLQQGASGGTATYANPELGYDRLPVNVLRQGKEFRDYEVNAMLQLMPARVQDGTRYVTQGDLDSAMSKINQDIPKFQADRLKSLASTPASPPVIHHGGGPSITDAPDKGSRSSSGGDDALRAYQQKLRDQIAQSKAHIELIDHDMTDEGKTFAEYRKAVLPWLNILDAAHLKLAKSENDLAYQVLSKGGLTDSAVILDKGKDRFDSERQARLDKQNEASDKAREQWAEGERLRSEDVANLQKYYNSNNDDYASGVNQSAQAQIRALQLGTHPNSIFANQDQEQAGVANSTVGILQRAVNQISSIANPSKETADALSQLREQLMQAKFAVANLEDKATADAFQRRIRSLDTAYDEQVKGVDSRRRPRSTNDNTLFAFEDQKLLDLANLAMEMMKAKQALPDYQGKDKDVMAATAAAEVAKNREQQYRQDYTDQKYIQDRDRLSGYATSAALSLYHGEKPGQVVKKIGDQVVDTSITSYIKNMFDPQSQTAKRQTDAVLDNTKAVKKLTATIGGDEGSSSGGTKANLMGLGAAAGLGGYAAFAAATGFSPSGRSSGGGLSAASGGGSKSQSGKDIGKAGTYLNYGLAAYSDFEQGKQNGPLGGAINGVIAGASIAGPVGAAVGGFVGLLGGLFGGHHKDPMADNKRQDPSYYNSPSDFDYYAYRYRATGKLPSIPGQNLGTIAPSNVSVYVDGVKTAVGQQMNSATSAGSMATTNVYYDATKPI